MTRFTTSLLAASAALTIASVASAQVLINDDFSRTEAGTFGSTPEGIAYISNQTAQAVDGSVATFGQSANTLAADLAPLAPTGYTVSFDAQRNISGPGFVSFFTGVSDAVNPALIFDISNTEADYGVLVQQNNDVAGELIARIFLNGVESASFPLAGSDNTAAFSVEFTVDAPSGYGAGATGTIDLSVDGTFLGSETITFDGNNSGVATVSSAIADATIDNLRVAIPEPASLGLLGLGGLALLRRRK